MKRTKIIATLGPASESKEILNQMVAEGMNVARLNFSHGTFEWHKNVITTLRGLSVEHGQEIGIIADLQGPKIRIAQEQPETPVKKGEAVFIASSGEKVDITGNSGHLVYLDLPKAHELITTESEILVEDGLIKMKVISITGNLIQTAVIDGGTIKPRKGVNIPGLSANLAALTERDKECLRFALKEGVDFIAMSFVRNAKEILELRELIANELEGQTVLPQIVAKIERREAVAAFDEIMQASDVIMVARGDLGIETPQEDLPVLQKTMVSKCLLTGKPVIVATQMLDSMIHNPRPTRAEISDVSNAVIDHADAVMLSGETAGGAYPVQTVQTMRQIIEETEKSPFDDLPKGFLGDQNESISAAIAESAHELAKNSDSQAIVVASISGYTARMIARHRPQRPIFVMTNDVVANRQLSMLWGVQSFLLADCQTLDELIDKSIAELKLKDKIKSGDRVIIVTGRPHVVKEHMSLVKVEDVK